MPQLWIALNVLMVILLPKARGSRVFWAIQAVQLCEIPLLGLAPDWECWSRIDMLNIPLEIAAIAFAAKFPVARWMMIAHVALKLHEIWDIDCEWQRVDGFLFWLRNELNLAILLVLLGYALRYAIPRIWRHYALRTRTEAA